ncbi:alpha amylase N-terminal ig-like domain-containing protein [Aquimarina sp. Aq78]
MIVLAIFFNPNDQYCYVNKKHDLYVRLTIQKRNVTTLPELRIRTS